MDSYTSMIKKLTDTKLYLVRTGGRTYAELKAFAAGLDLLFNELDEMLKNISLTRRKVTDLPNGKDLQAQ